MFKKTVAPIFYFVISATLLISCNRDPDDVPQPGQSRKVKYEITGNFSGKLLILLNDNVSGNTIINNVSLPWTKEIDYAPNVQGIGFGGTSETNGVAGQTVRVKFYVGGVLKKDEPGIANAAGGMSLPTLAHVFQ